MRFDNMNLEKLFHMFRGLDDRKTTKILNLHGGVKESGIKSQES